MSSRFPSILVLNAVAGSVVRCALTVNAVGSFLPKPARNLASKSNTTAPVLGSIVPCSQQILDRSNTEAVVVLARTR